MLKEYLRGLRNREVAVLGYGISNAPLVRLLTEEGVSVTVRDRKPLPEIPGVRCISGDGYLQNLTEQVVFRTPGIRPDAVTLPEGAVLTSEMETFLELCPCPVIAVTGSDGKTTTTTLISELLKRSGRKVWLGGNIGHPLLAEVDEICPEDYAVVELSSFQLMTLRHPAQIAVVTNVRPNHLDWHRDLDEYAQAKKHVFLGQQPGDRLVLNADDPVSAAFAAEAGGEVRRFSREQREADCCFDGEAVRLDGERLVERSEIFLPGLHNVENLMAAFCAVYELVGAEVCRSVARDFRGVPHRLEPVREKDGVRYYNDSIASSPSRTIANLRVFPERNTVLIAGGYDKHIPYDALGPEINAHVRVLVLNGATAPAIREAVQNAAGEHPQLIEEPDFRKAVLAAAEAARPGEQVLLSPASASFDQFRNFEERGDAFKQIVMSL